MSYIANQYFNPRLLGGVIGLAISAGINYSKQEKLSFTYTSSNPLDIQHFRTPSTTSAKYKVGVIAASITYGALIASGLANTIFNSYLTTIIVSVGALAGLVIGENFLDKTKATVRIISSLEKLIPDHSPVVTSQRDTTYNIPIDPAIAVFVKVASIVGGAVLASHLPYLASLAKNALRAI